MPGAKITTVTVVSSQQSRHLSLPATTMASQAQQVNVTDLDLSQLSEVRKQLEDVRPHNDSLDGDTDLTAGIDTSHQLLRAAEASAGQVQGVHRERC